MHDEIDPDRSQTGETQSFMQGDQSLDAEIGPFKLLQILGEGGMGTVYMAQQETPVRRRVALKVIKPGMDSKQVLGRFEAERQAMSMMQHPNIAQALDVGTTESGRPYFVMELVKGLPITEYCDQKRLSIRARLKLFKVVCHAVQHAHQKGIIHRDIKPSNILVAEFDSKPVPKVIDFGLAKALHFQLTDRTVFTQFGQAVGTFEYMSPEQSRMNELDVDTRTDVYSLGVLLYELLTGTVPFEKKRLRSAALEQVLKIIREEEPVKPSTRLSKVESGMEAAKNRGMEPARLSNLMRGDLDCIALKAMEKEPDRRYESSNALAVDVQRYLDGDPVAAAPPSTTYRLRKFAKRNRVLVSVILIVASALFMTVVGTSVAMFWALDAWEKADVQAANAEAQAQIAEEQAQIADAERENAKYSQYISNLPAASSFINDFSMLPARAMLTTAPVEHRNFEWAFLANLAWPEGQYRTLGSNTIAQRTDRIGDFWSGGRPSKIRDLVPHEYSGGLHSCFYSNDSQSVFITKANGSIQRYSIRTGALQANYQQPKGIAIKPAQSRNGMKLASFTFENRGAIWNVESEEILAKQTAEKPLGGAWACYWSPDDKYLVTAHMGGVLQIWDSDNMQQIATCVGHAKGFSDVFFEHDSKSFWSASNDGTVRQWTLPAGQLVAPNATQAPTDKKLEFHRISPKGNLAFAMCRDGTHFIWNIRTGKLVHQLSDTARAPFLGQPRTCAAFAADESCVAVVTGTNEVTFYDCQTGEIIQSFPVEGLALRLIELSPDGRTLLAASQATYCTIWTSRRDDEVKLSNAHGQVAFQIDIDAAANKLLVGSFDEKASIWDLESQTRQTVYDGHSCEIVAVDLHPNGLLAVTLDARGNLCGWDTQSGETRFRIESESDQFAKYIGSAGGSLRANVLNFPAPLSTGLLSPDGSRFVTFQKDCMKVFDARDGEEIVALDGATDTGWPVFNFNSSLVAILGMNKKDIRVWDLKTGKELAPLPPGHETYLVMMDFSPNDDRLASSAMGGEVIIWNARTSEKIRSLTAPTGNATSCRFSPDGAKVIVSYTDATARVWDAQTGEIESTLTGHSTWVRDIRLNPDQSRLLSWSLDDRVILWDTRGPLANQLASQSSSSKLIQALWTPDGRQIITAWSDGGIKIWRGATRKDLESLTLDLAEDVGEQFNLWRQKNMRPGN